MIARRIACLCLMISLFTSTFITASEKLSWWPFDFSSTQTVEQPKEQIVPDKEKKSTFFTRCQQWTAPVLIGAVLLVAEHAYNRHQRNNLRTAFNENMTETRNVMSEEFTKQFEKQANQLQLFRQELQKIQARNEILAVALNDALGYEDEVPPVERKEP